MLYVKSYSVVNGNSKTKNYRVIKQFETTDQLEAERDRLKEKHQVDAVDFTKIVDTGKEVPDSDKLKEIFE